MVKNKLTLDNISPNDDFYNYVNLSWLNNSKNSIPEDYSSWGGLIELYDQDIKKQCNIIDSLKTTNLFGNSKKIYSIWLASKNRFKLWNDNESNYDPLINEFKELRNHFNFDKLSSINYNSYIISIANYLHYSHMNDINNVIDFRCSSDLENINHIVLDLSVCGLSLPSREYYLDKILEHDMNAFKSHLDNIKNIIENNTEIKLDDNFSDNVINFETQIAMYTMKPDQAREFKKYYTNTNITDLYMKINDLKSLDKKQENYDENNRNLTLNNEMIQYVQILFEEIYSLFDLRRIMQENYNNNFKNKDHENVQSNQYHLTAYDGDAIRRCLYTILDTDNFNEYYSYIQYQIISKVREICSKELDYEFFDFYQRKLSGQKKQKSEEKRNINTINLYAGEMLGKLYVEYYFKESYKKDISKMTDNIISIMHDSLYNNNWLTEQTKKKALQKLSFFQSKIGYPDKWNDYENLDINIGDNLYEISKKSNEWNLNKNFFEKINSTLDREEWYMDPQAINAYFMPTKNEIVFPAAILQPPLYHSTIKSIDFDIKEEQELLEDVDILIAVNYGSIGSIIAHEITHGYDDQGKHFDHNGNINNWWTDEDNFLFHKKTEQIIYSVNKYSYLNNGIEYKINPELTMGENIADISGLTISMKSLLKHLNDKNSSDMFINTSLKLFFKSWCSIWKQNINNDKKIMLLKVDPHSPNEFRGNLVQHMDEFHKVFGINKSDKMYLAPENRLKLW